MPEALPVSGKVGNASGINNKNDELFKVECESNNLASAFFCRIRIHETVGHAWVAEALNVFRVKVVCQSKAEFQFRTQLEERQIEIATQSKFQE